MQKRIFKIKNKEKLQRESHDILFILHGDNKAHFAEVSFYFLFAKNFLVALDIDLLLFSN